MTKRVFFPNLDALRSIACLSVFASHTLHADDPSVLATPIFALLRRLKVPGALGVNFFFVLSGFLITYLLLEERALRGKIDVFQFYVRRALRIWPLYYAVVLTGFFVYPLLKAGAGRQAVENAHLIPYLLFAGNFDIIHNGALPDSSILGVMWSLAVEEQFYLFWPIVMSLVKERHYPALFGSMIAGTLAYRYFAAGEAYRLGMGTLAVISDMVVGAVLAYYSRARAPLLERARKLPAAVIALGYLLGVPLVVWLFYARGPWIETFSRLATSLVFAFIIWEQNDAENSPLKLGRSKLLSELGKRTYGLYCLHFFGILFALNVNRRFLHLNHTWWQIVFVETPLALGVALVLTWISFRWFERPFLTLKERFSTVEAAR